MERSSCASAWEESYGVRGEDPTLNSARLSSLRSAARASGSSSVKRTAKPECVVRTTSDESSPANARHDARKPSGVPGEGVGKAGSISAPEKEMFAILPLPSRSPLAY